MCRLSPARGHYFNEPRPNVLAKESKPSSRVDELDKISVAKELSFFFFLWATMIEKFPDRFVPCNLRLCSMLK